MNEQYIIIKTIIESFLEKMGINGFVDFIENTDFQQFIIKTNEANLLIGENGQNLIALNIILKKIINKKLNNQKTFPFILDVNGYQIKKIDDIKDIARINAQRARFLKKDILLKPMNAYERRIIHTTLASYPDVTTESIGEEENRRIVIKPI
jgi:spoIIIJ-associated protein